jgi:hypothetical protein
MSVVELLQTHIHEFADTPSDTVADESLMETARSVEKSTDESSSVDDSEETRSA